MTINKLFFIPFIIISLSSCGDSATSSNESGSTFGSAGSTPFSGTWTLNANISIQAGTQSTQITETSTISVNSNGTVGISQTTTNCSLQINFNGSQINYQTTCLVNNGVENAAACVITFTGFAAISGSISSASAAGSFSPRTFACNGATISYTGTISGSNTSGTTTTTTTT